MRGMLVVLMGLVLHAGPVDKKDVDFQNKALLKILQKHGINSFSQLSEISADDPVRIPYMLQGKFFEVRSDAGQYRYIYIGRVNSCRGGTCSLSPEITLSEYFDYLIIYDRDKTVRLVRVFNYQATHGQEITAKGWLKQFIGYDHSQPLQVGKNIDAISGATISAMAITSDIEEKSGILNSLRKTTH